MMVLYEPATMVDLKKGFVYYGYAESKLAPGKWKAWGKAKRSDEDQTEERAFPDEWDEGINYPTSGPKIIRDIDILK